MAGRRSAVGNDSLGHLTPLRTTFCKLEAPFSERSELTPTPEKVERLILTND
jgi:hypothetical protein